MPLETATYIPDLVTSNPAHSDGLNNADAHIRLIKGTLKATFVNFTDVALTSTQAQLDAAAGAVNTNGIAVLADAGPNFKTNTTDGLRNPSAGTVGISTGGTVSTTFTATGLTSTSFFGGGAFPIGGILIWPFDTLPTGMGTFAWCNGGTVSRTTYPAYQAMCAAASYPYGNGDGSTTVGLPNYQEVTLVGKSTMGGASSPGLLTSISSGLKGLIGKIFGADTTTLSTSNLPPYTPSGTVVTTTSVGGGATFGVAPTGSNLGLGGTNTGGTIGNLNGALVSASTFTGNAQGGTSTAISRLPPMQTTNFIIRIA